MQTLTLTLLGTAHCHLCEEAEAMLSQPLLEQNTPKNTLALLHKLDIADDDDLYSLYATKIPVLQASNEQETIELHWPFTTTDIKTTLATLAL